MIDDAALARTLAGRPRARLRDGSLVSSAVLVPVFEVSGQDHLLLVVRAKDLARHPGQIAFPGGVTEPDDADAVDTALRETEEEVGVSRTRVRVLGLLDDVFTGQAFRITPVVGRVDGPPPTMPADREVDQILCRPLAELADPARLHMERRSFRGRDVEVPFIDLPGHQVWGATARILLDLLRLR